MAKCLDLSDKSKCCGCFACQNACPKKAISICEDINGSKYPIIDEKKCIQCGICSNTCNFKNLKYLSEPKKGYAAFSKDEKLLNGSASGGVFSTIAEKYLSDGWKICGCIGFFQNDKYIVEHVLSDDLQVVRKMYGSKYVQSSISNVLIQVKESLLKGEKILFSGTPCQISALKGYLKKDFSNLYTIEIICHGVPSQKMLNDYISFYNKKHNCCIEDISFRTKKYGWNNVGYIKYRKEKNNKVYYKDLFFNESSYYYLFEKGYFFRESCYKCPFSGIVRVGDLTIGDYWGIEKVHPELIEKIDFKKGVSCILVNSKIGTEIINDCNDKLYLFESSVDNIKKYNRQLNQPTKKPDDFDKILEDYKQLGYEVIEKFFTNKNKNYKLQILKNRIKKILRSTGIKERRN